MMSASAKPSSSAAQPSLRDFVWASIANRGISPATARTRFEVFALFVLLVIAAGFWHHLGSGDLKDWDESVYAWRALVIHERGDLKTWIDQGPYSWMGYYSGAFPPLLVWSSAIFFNLLGTTEFAHRIFCCFCGGLALFGMYVLGRSVHSRLAGLLGGMALGGIFFWVRFARRGQFDVPFVCFTVCAQALYAWAVFRVPDDDTKRQRLLLMGAGVMLGLGLMSKILITGIIAGGTAFLASLYFAVSCHRSWRRCLADAGWMLLPAAIIAVPWHVAVSFSGGREFWFYYIKFHLLQRTSQVLDGHSLPWYYYLDTLRMEVPLATLVAFVLGTASLALRTLFNRRPGGGSLPDPLLPSSEKPPNCARGVRPAAFFTLVVGLFPLALYTAAQTRRDAYLLPILPGVALIAGVYIADILQRARGVAVPAICGVLFFTYGWQGSRTWAKSLNHLLATEPGFLLTPDGIDFLWNTMGVVALVALGMALALAIAGWLWRPAGRRMAAFAGLLFLTVFLHDNFAEGYKSSYDPLKGRRHYGWHGLREMLHDENHDVIIFYGTYHEPAKAFYLKGLDYLSLQQPPNQQLWVPSDLALELTHQSNPAVVVDLKQLPVNDPQMRGILEELVFVKQSGQLAVLGKPGSAFVRKYAISRAQTRGAMPYLNFNNLLDDDTAMERPSNSTDPVTIVPGVTRY